MRITLASVGGVGAGLLAGGFALLLALVAGPAGAAECGAGPEDVDAVAAVVTDARDACPCDAFDGRSAYRDCVRNEIDAAIAGSTMPRRCRGTAMRFARRSTCGAPETKVTCCKRNGSCTIANSAASCEAIGGGTAEVGHTESCYDACVPAPTPSPRITPTPSAQPTVCCACACRPPYYEGCSGTHQCSAPLPGATSPEQCDALDDAAKDCAHVFVTCDLHDPDLIPYPLCR